MNVLSSSSLLRFLAMVWVVSGAFGFFEAAGGLFAGEGPYPTVWWVWNLALSAGVVVAGIGVLARQEGAIWLAMLAIGASLAQAVVLFTSSAPGMPNPIVAATILVHVLGLAALGSWFRRDRVATDVGSQW